MPATAPRQGLCRALCLIVTIGGATLAGAWWGARPPRPTSSVPAVSMAPPLPPAGFHSTSKVPSAAQAWVEEIERERNPAAQAAAAARLAARLTPNEWPLALTHLNEFSFSLTRAIFEAAIIRRWAKHDPSAAAAWGLDHSGELAAVAAGEWVKRDPESARAWFESLTPHQRSAYQLQGTYFLALVKQDRAAAFAAMLAHANDPKFNLSRVEQEIVTLAPEEALSLSEKVTNKDFRESIRAAVAREYGRRDPSAAVAWAKQQPDADALLPAIFQQHKEPPARMIPALAQLAPERQKHILENSWAWWERGDPFPTLEALRSAPASLSTESRQNLINRMMVSLTDHYDIAESVRRLESEWGDFAGSWERLVAANWSRDDPAAARAWIDQLPTGAIRQGALAAYDEAEKARTVATTPRDSTETTLQSIARPIMQMDSFGPEPFIHVSLRQLNRLEAEERRELWQKSADLPADTRRQARENLITFAAMTDPQEAASWLRPPPGESPDTALACRLAAHWALDDAPAAAQWIATFPDGVAKTWATWNLARQWHRVDAQAVDHWSSSQSPSIRDAVARAIAGQRPDQ